MWQRRWPAYSANGGGKYNAYKVLMNLIYHGNLRDPTCKIFKLLTRAIYVCILMRKGGLQNGTPQSLCCHWFVGLISFEDLPRSVGYENTLEVKMCSSVPDTKCDNNVWLLQGYVPRLPISRGNQSNFGPIFLMFPISAFDGMHNRCAYSSKSQAMVHC